MGFDCLHSVQLAVSPIAGPLAGISVATAYHTSVLVDGMEFSFNTTDGIIVCDGPLSHKLWQPDGQLHDLGRSAHSGKDMVAALEHKFQPGTYDLLRKNCNHFSDCALFFLLGRRLSAEYCSLERLGAAIPAVVETLSGGRYTPNPLAADFGLEALIRDLGVKLPVDLASTGSSCDDVPTAATKVMCNVFEALPGTLASLIGRCCTPVPHPHTKMVQIHGGVTKSRYPEGAKIGDQQTAVCRVRRCYMV